MSKGPGKIQAAVLEYLRERINEPSQGQFTAHRLGPNGWCYASSIVYSVYQIDLEKLEPPTRAQYVSVYRAISSLEKKGLVKKGFWTSWYSGKQRGPTPKYAPPFWERDEGGGYVETLFVKLVSVD